MKKVIGFIFLSCAISACKTDLVYMSVLEPAPVSIPSYVKNAGIIDRSPASEETKKLDALDKVLSVEGKELDKEGAKESISGLKNELMKNSRFAGIKEIDAGLTTTGAGVFPAPLSWETIEKICNENSLDAVFALELFDTESKISYQAVPVTVTTPVGSVPAVEHQANMVTIVKTGWRIYDPKSRTILDEHPITKSLTFSGRGINPVAAAAALIGRKEAVKQAANQAGKEYAGSILPYWIRVSRDYYVKGNDSFKRAKRYAQAGKWDNAAELWKKETTNTDSKVAGRAFYNMAIINEINGNLDTAIEWAQKAYADYNNKLALRYVRILENRVARNDRLKRQQE